MWQRRNEWVLINVATDNSVCRCWFLVHPASPLGFTTRWYVIQQRGETSRSRELRPKQVKYIKTVLFGSPNSGIQGSHKQHVWREISQRRRRGQLNNLFASISPLLFVCSSSSLLLFFSKNKKKLKPHVAQHVFFF